MKTESNFLNEPEGKLVDFGIRKFDKSCPSVVVLDRRSFLIVFDDFMPVAKLNPQWELVFSNKLSCSQFLFNFQISLSIGKFVLFFEFCVDFDLEACMWHCATDWARDFSLECFHQAVHAYTVVTWKSNWLNHTNEANRTSNLKLLVELLAYLLQLFDVLWRLLLLDVFVFLLSFWNVAFRNLFL